MSLITYTYVIPTDFTSGPGINGLYLNSGQLFDEIVAETGITSATLIRIDTTSLDVFVRFDGTLSAPEITLLDAVINAHIPVESVELVSS